MHFSIVCHMHNEEEILPYFLMHWRSRVDHAYILDDGPSTDRTAEIIASEMPHWDIIPRESSEWDSPEIDRLCRDLERQAEGWVITVTADEFLYPTRRELEELFAAAETGGHTYIIPEGYHVIEHPTESFDPELPFEEQFFWGIRDGAVDRVIHRDQNEAVWKYPVGRHRVPALYGSMFPAQVLLGDHKYAPKELSFRRRLVDAGRVGPGERARGLSSNKWSLTRESMRIEFDRMLARAVKFR